ncbi:alpha/beta hydrolase [Alteraurantiacibacter buctensis]|uniref:Alpha/beta hydrolase n=1 Tax=Alteraurantiacibacter buctensis TaxID=1503981 RepID=A0A844Z1Y1_9SPHN|nr:alpha/beta hydrolase [Alteraurantiacibacter buctensis]MXO71913.1 alpha/beta hydrolase [Alteraurantiacibacter buctensis]
MGFRLTIGMLALALAAPVAAQSGPPPITAVSAPALQDAIPLYGAQTPGNRATENWGQAPNGDRTVRNVTYPTLEPFLPDPALATGAAVIVLPGGGFMMLSYDHEGTRVARQLAARGIAAFVLKYRLFSTPAGEAEAAAEVSRRIGAAFASPAGPDSLYNPDAGADAAAALAMVRARANEWHIDSSRTGMIGFSAGARTSLMTVLGAEAQDQPAFFGYIYGDLASRPVPAAAPPMFAARALDDQLYPNGPLDLVRDWQAAGRGAELHLYQHGGHGFGLGAAGTTSTGVLDQFIAWLESNGWLEDRD